MGSQHRPYSAENCRLVCAMVNMAMNEFGLEMLLVVAQKLRKRKSSSLEISAILWKPEPRQSRGLP